MEKYERVAHAAGGVYKRIIGFERELEEFRNNAQLTGLCIGYDGEPTAEDLLVKAREFSETMSQILFGMGKWAAELQSEEE